MGQFDDRVSFLRTEILYRGSRLRFERDYVQIDGRETAYDCVRHPGAVVVLPVTDAGNLVLVEQYRVATRCSILEFPAGTLEAGESPIVCAAREIQEEIGYAAEDLLPLGDVFAAPGFCDERQYFFLARKLKRAKLPGDLDELLVPVEVSVAEFERRVVAGEVRDGKSLAIFTAARLRGFV